MPPGAKDASCLVLGVERETRPGEVTERVGLVIDQAASGCSAVGRYRHSGSARVQFVAKLNEQRNTPRSATRQPSIGAQRRFTKTGRCHR